MLSALRVSSSLLALVTLTACGGNGTALLSFADRLEAEAVIANRLAATPGTAWSAMPTTGSADYAGAAVLFIDPDFEADVDDIIILGDSHLTANFSAGTMTGHIDNMQGVTNITETAADVSNVGGRIDIGNNTSIIGDDFDDNFTNRPNDWYADYYGDLTFDGDRYEVQGTIDGQFVGTRANPSSGQSPARGVIGVSEDGYAVINGQYEVNEAAASLEIFGEN